MMRNFKLRGILNDDQSVEVNYNPNRPYIPDYHYRI